VTGSYLDNLKVVTVLHKRRDEGVPEIMPPEFLDPGTFHDALKPLLVTPEGEYGIGWTLLGFSLLRLRRVRGIAWISRSALSTSSIMLTTR
jgi:hypothetical protein